ncbi:MAG: MFS transporter [Verrucomicrobiae bacterium]|nr:MFS transporter [Verrucomicrobiae bacterium]
MSGTPQPAAPVLPKGITNAYWFQAFNAVSWQICLGNPLILFARELGASATTIGLLAGLMPLLTIAQIPASHYAERIGYRRLMLCGWSARVTVLVFLFLLPLTEAFLTRNAMVVLLLAIMFLFNLLRGIATCSWFPWISAIVPLSLRGYYLSMDRSFINVASVMALLFSGGILARGAGMKAFALVFFVGFLGGAISLYFLKRIPEPPATAGGAEKEQAAAWGDVIRDGDFLRFLGFGVAVPLGLFASTTFGVVFLREEIGLGNGAILYLNAASALAGMTGLSLQGRHADRIGSKPFLGLAWVWWLASLLVWFLLAARVLPCPRQIAMANMVVGGFFGSIYELSSTRLLMNTVGHKPGRARYFALYAVAVSLTAGLIPIPWGGVLDGLRHMRLELWGMTLDRYVVLYGAAWLSLFGIVILLARVREPKSKPAVFMVYEVFVGMPVRGLTQLLQWFR